MYLFSRVALPVQRRFGAASARYASDWQALSSSPIKNGHIFVCPELGGDSLAIRWQFTGDSLPFPMRWYLCARASEGIGAFQKQVTGEGPRFAAPHCWPLSVRPLWPSWRSVLHVWYKQHSWKNLLIKFASIETFNLKHSQSKLLCLRGAFGAAR